MKALALYHDLKARGVVLEAQGGYLKVSAPAGVLTEEDKTILKELKTNLLKFLSRLVEMPEQSLERKSLARWAGPGLIRILDPFTGAWHEWPAAKCLPGVVAEADRRSKGDRWE
jgi:hypothetical protein